MIVQKDWERDKWDVLLINYKDGEQTETVMFSSDSAEECLDHLTTLERNQ